HLHTLLANYPRRLTARLLHIVLFPLGRRLRAPADALTLQAAGLVQSPTGTRLRLTAEANRENEPGNALGRLESALARASDMEVLQQRVARAVRAGKIRELRADAQVHAAQAQGLLNEDEALALRHYLHDVQAL